MAAEYDLVIRGGTIADGTGGDLIAGDVAIAGGRIAAIGAVSGSGAEEIDANSRRFISKVQGLVRGKLVFEAKITGMAI